MPMAATLRKLNASALALIETALQSTNVRVDEHRIAGARVLDFGVHAVSGLEAGLLLARICLADFASVSVNTGQLDRHNWPTISVRSDHPLLACLCSQYAGWRVAVEDYFAMGSGPMRAVAQVEPLFEELDYREQGGPCVGVLESASLPPEIAVRWLSEKLKIDPTELTLCVAPTASLAGTVQVVARTLETALHQLHERGFEMDWINSGMGLAPVPPIAADDLTAIGWTNDAILYGGCVMLWVNGDDKRITEIGPRIPASGSRAYGRPFLELFEEAGRDFYKLDPHLFSPAEITIHNMTSGRVHRFGTTAPEILKKSFGL